MHLNFTTGIVLCNNARIEREDTSGTLSGGSTLHYALEPMSDCFVSDNQRAAVAVSSETFDLHDPRAQNAR